MAYDPTPDAPTLFAAVKAIEKQLGKESLQPGLHPIDAVFTMRLKGTIEKAEQQTYQAKAKFSYGVFLTLLCQRAKLNRSDAKRLIGECATAAIGFGEEIPDKPGFEDRVRDANEAIEAAIEAAPKTTQAKAGATKWLGQCSFEKTT